MVQQLWSIAHQLVEISIIINCLLFYSAPSIDPVVKSLRQILPFSCLYAFPATDIHPQNKNLFFRLIFSFSFIYFEIAFSSSDIASKEGTSPWLGMF